MINTEKAIEKARKYNEVMKVGTMMSKLNIKANSAGVKFDDIKAQLMKNEEFEDEYNKLQPRYELISQTIEVRKSMEMTQEELEKE